MKNMKINNVVERFCALPVQGRFEKFEHLPYVANIIEHHVQGYSRGTINGQRYAGFTHSDNDEGKIIFTTGTNGDVVYVTTPEYNHPSGIQFFDRYAFVSTSHKGAKVFVYDVEQLISEYTTEPIKTFSFSNHGGTTMGVADFEYCGKSYIMLAIISNESLCYFYISENSNSIDELNFKSYGYSPLGSIRCPVYKSNSYEPVTEFISDIHTQCVGLVTQDDNQIYLVVTLSTSCEKEDYAYLFPIKVQCFDSSTFEVSFDYANIIGKQFENDGGVKGSSGTHFRWGAGVEITEDNQFNVLATSRNVIAGTFLNTTIWDVLETPTDGSKNPVGYVTFESGGGYTVEFTLIYKNSDGIEVKEQTGRLLAGQDKQYDLPAGASDYKVSCRAWNGSKWKDPFFTKEQDTPFNCTFRTYGALPNPKMKIVQE